MLDYWVSVGVRVTVRVGLGLGWGYGFPTTNFSVAQSPAAKLLLPSFPTAQFSVNGSHYLALRFFRTRKSTYSENIGQSR